MNAEVYPRLLAPVAREILSDTRVVLVNGPRQAGKTTFLRELSNSKRSYVTLDNAATLAAALADPTGFVRDLDFAAIDEVQRAPQLLLAIKESVDADTRPGRFLVSGSADVMMLSNVADSLAGRLEVLTLLPLAQCELLKAKPTFITHALAAEPPHVGERITGADLVETVIAGGYPEALTRRSGSRRSQWYANYVDTIVQRDLADVATVSDLAMLPRLLQALGEHAAQLVNYTEIGGQLGISHVTTHKYLTALELVFLVRSVAPYFSSPLKRLVKTPKVHFFDSGLLAALLAVDAGDVRADRKLFGSLLESFVFGEISKLLSRESRRPRIFHYRDREKNEIDFVVEDARKRITCIEVKASATVSPSDFAMMKKVAAAAPAKFNAGYVLYDGDRVLPFGERLWAAPISCLWG